MARATRPTARVLVRSGHWCDGSAHASARRVAVLPPWRPTTVGARSRRLHRAHTSGADQQLGALCRQTPGIMHGHWPLHGQGLSDCLHSCVVAMPCRLAPYIAHPRWAAWSTAWDAPLYSGLAPLACVAGLSSPCLYDPDWSSLLGRLGHCSVGKHRRHFLVAAVSSYYAPIVYWVPGRDCDEALSSGPPPGLVTSILFFTDAGWSGWTPAGNRTPSGRGWQATRLGSLASPEQDFATRRTCLHPTGSRRDASARHIAGRRAQAARYCVEHGHRPHTPRSTPLRPSAHPAMPANLLHAHDLRCKAPTSPGAPHRPTPPPPAAPHRRPPYPGSDCCCLPLCLQTLLEWRG